MNRVYWDGGPNAIARFMAHHLKECQNNIICNALELRSIEFEDSESESSTSNCFKSVSPGKRLTRSQIPSSGAKNNPLRIGT